MSKPELNRYKERMDKAITALKEEFAGLRTGRANAGLIENVMVDAYGSTSPITSVAAISVPEPRMITVSVWDKGVTIAVEKAIRNAGLGLNPITDGQTLRIPIPPLTEERRRDLAKLAGNVRREALEDLKKAEKAGDLSQDEQKRADKDVQGFTDEAVKRIDETLRSKEAEIMQV